MSGLEHGWGRDRNGHADFIHGAVPISDFDEEFRYKKPSRSNWNGKRKRACKRSKTGEKCDFTVAIITRQWYSSYTETWHYTRVMTCKRCGKHGAWGFFETKESIH